MYKSFNHSPLIVTVHYRNQSRHYTQLNDEQETCILQNVEPSQYGQKGPKTPQYCLNLAPKLNVCPVSFSFPQCSSVNGCGREFDISLIGACHVRSNQQLIRCSDQRQLERHYVRKFVFIQSSIKLINALIPVGPQQPANQFWAW